MWSLFLVLFVGLNAQLFNNGPIVPGAPRPPQSIGRSQVNFLNTITNPQQPGIAGSRRGFAQSPRITATNFKDIDWTQVDRRTEDGWWHLYPFGEMYFDSERSSRPWMDKQIDLDFFFPYYGFRFNYTFIFNEGFIAFSYPWYIQPPYTFPNPRWPDKPDPSLIAAFMSEQTVQFVGETRISNVFYRVIESYYRTYHGQQLKTVTGRVEDPALLDQITRDIQDSMVGARGWTADYALIVTWERMAYGGSPKVTNLNEYERAKRWQNTYQMVIATDEIRSYTIFNYANVNWTSSSAAGALTGGRGGKQSALVGFNGGNFTGYYELPYSARGNSYKLVQFGSTQTAGRWLARVDEEIQYGGCTNESRGNIQLSQQYGNMLGGFSLNVSGPCYRANNIVKLQLDQLTLDCERVDMVISRCIVPVNGIYRTGLVDVKLSVDGGKNYPWWNKFYILQPGLARRRVNLVNDPLERKNNWNSFQAQNLTLTWQWQNITVNPNAQVDITLWGYWEDVTTHIFKQIGAIAMRVPNSGAFYFNPQTIQYDMQESDREAWRWYHGGIVQVRVSETWHSDKGDSIYWSTPVPFGWYFHRKWQYEYGRNWAHEICKEWFDYDGRRENFYMELEPKIPCPCTLDQALMDIGRYTGHPSCDMAGNQECYYTQGAQHCVVSTISVAHPWGSFPYKRPPYVPTMSNFYNDLLPYDYCCKWAGQCEFLFWRRQTSSCQMYRPPTIGYAYGEPHFVTYDGAKYTFNGKGYYILTMMKSPRHDLMVQIRMEQPPKTLWNSEVRATVITGLAAKDNSSAIVQVFARKDFRRWRYKTDVYVDGVRIYFDMAWKKIQTFKGVTLRSPPRNMNMSEIEIMFTTGVGVRVQEARGLLNIMVSLPNNYNQSRVRPLYGHTGEFSEFDGANRGGIFDIFSSDADRLRSDDLEYTGSSYGKCATHFRSLGLLGTFNNDVGDELTTPDCNEVRVNTFGQHSENEARQIYYDFGEKWRLERNPKYTSLFQIEFTAIYNPLKFASQHFEPVFDPWKISNTTFWESLIFSREEVQVACQGARSCEFDYIQTGRREIGLDTLNTERKYEGLKQKGEVIHASCGPLMKNRGVIKHPPGNNYLDGVTVTFTCKPDYFLHGDQQRTCINGTWTPGWWVWCRKRSFEIALKWMTALLTAFFIILTIVLIFVWCYYLGKKKRSAQGGGYHAQPLRPPPMKMPTRQYQAPAISKPSPIGSSPIPVMSTEPPKVGMGRFSETSA